MSIDVVFTDDDFDGVADQTVVDNISDDVVGFTVTETSSNTEVTEAGGTDSFTLVLDAEPTSNVVIDITSDDTGEVTVSTASLTFTTANWDTPQTVTVTGVDDDIVDGTQMATITMSVDDVSSDDNYDPLNDEKIDISNADNDNASVTIADVSGAENGGVITVTATLDNDVQGGFTVDVNTTDGTATTDDSDYTAVTSETLTFTGTAGETQTFTLIPTADTKLETDETVIVSMDNLTSTSLSVDITDGATATITNDDTPPTVEFGIATDSQPENESSQELPILLSAVSGLTATVDYTLAGTATGSGTDYAFVDGTFTFSAGEQNLTFGLSGIIDDALDEDNETIIITLSNPVNATLGTQSTFTYTITDNDDSPTVSLSASDNTLAEASGAITLTATLSEVSGRDVTVNLTYTGTAVNGTDYNSTASTSILISAGSTSAEAAVGITVTQDTNPEPDETIVVSINGVTNATKQGTQEVTLTIEDDDDSMPPSGYSISFDDALVGSVETGTTQATFASAEVGASYNYSITSTNGGIAVTGSGTIATSTDQITLADLSDLSDGTLTISVTLTDIAGNVGDAFTAITVLDATAPAAPVVVSITDDSGESDTDQITNDNTLSFAGTAEAGVTVEVLIGGTSIGETTVTDAGDWTFDHSGTTLSDGAYSITAKATDAAGNTSDSSAALGVTVDTDNPGVAITTSAASALNLSFSVTITFDEAVANFALSDIKVGNGTASALTSITADKVWTANITPTADGATTVQVESASANDTAGNDNTVSNIISITYDATAPIVIGITRADADQLNNDDADADFMVVFSEQVNGVGVSAFETATTSSATGEVNSVTQVDGKTYTVNVNGITGQGMVQLNSKADDSVTDNVGNSLELRLQEKHIPSTGFQQRLV